MRAHHFGPTPPDRNSARILGGMRAAMESFKDRMRLWIGFPGRAARTGPDRLSPIAVLARTSST